MRFAQCVFRFEPEDALGETRCSLLKIKRKKNSIQCAVFNELFALPKMFILNGMLTISHNKLF